MKPAILSLFILISTSLFANYQDSLLNLFKNDKADAETLNMLAASYYPNNLDSAKYFANIALEYAQQHKNNAHIAEAYYQLGDYYYYRGMADSILFYYHKSLNSFLKTKLQNDISGVYNDIGQVYQMINKHDSAKIYFNFALDYIDKESLPQGYYAILTNIATSFYHSGEYVYSNEQYFNILEEGENVLDRERLSAIYSNIGLNYKKLAIYDKAIVYYSKALETTDSVNDPLALAVDYSNIASLYISWKKYDFALEYFDKAFKIYKRFDRSCSMASINNNIAAAYRAKNDYQKALSNYNISLYTSINNNCDYELATAYHGLGLTYYKLFNYKKSIEFEIKALNIFENLNALNAITNTHFSLGRNYMATNDNKLAYYHLSTADSIAKETKSLDLMRDIALEFAKFYNANGQNDKSIPYYEKFIELNDSILNQKSHRLISEFQVKLDNLEKQRKLEKTELENEIQLAKILQKNKLLWIMASAAFLLIVLLILIYRLYILKNKSYRLLFEKNKEQLKEKEIETKIRIKKSEYEISDDIQQKILNGILKLMDEKKLYLDEDLTAHKLAEKLKTNTSYLSKVINENFDTNFNNFINKYRIDEAQRLILDKKYANYTLEAISKECGFKSKSTFNQAFKKFTGLTPSFYLSNKNN